VGRLSAREREAGYILLDVLAALLIVLIGFAVFLGGISLAASLSVRQAQKVQKMIEQRNVDAKDQTTLFQNE